MRTELQKTTQTLLTLLNTYGCLTLAQAGEICGGDQERAKRDLSHLILIHCARENDGIYVPVKDPKPDSLIIDALWVAIDKAKNEEGVVDMDMLAISFPNSPVQVCFIREDKFFNIVSLSEVNIASTLPYLMEKFAHQYKTADKAKGQEYIFVVRDKMTISEIADFAPAMPNRIALVEGDRLSIPKIRYLSPKKN